MRVVLVATVLLLAGFGRSAVAACPAVACGTGEVCCYATSDTDGDGDYPDYGTCIASDACTSPDGTTTAGEDCDDGNVLINPDAEETCQATTASPVDENCNGELDEGSDFDEGAANTTKVYLDSDGDEQKSITASYVCLNGPLLSSSTSPGEDCNDGNAAINSDTTKTKEVCDGVDNDCDCINKESDGDTGPIPSTNLCSCNTVGMDSDDCPSPNEDPQYKQAWEEGIIDELRDLDEDPDVSGCKLVYVDQDGDGSGSELSDGSCICDESTSDITVPDGVALSTSDYYTGADGWATTGDDCNDSEPRINPGADETVEPDGFDTDCDGFIPVFELDCDEDGHLPPGPIEASPSTCAESDERAITCYSRVQTINCRAFTKGSPKYPADLPDAVSYVWMADIDVQPLVDYMVNHAVDSCDEGMVCTAATDCDDQDDQRFVGNYELCDGLDNDCLDAPTLTMPDSNENGIPDAMATDATFVDELGVCSCEGSVSELELDLDGDGYVSEDCSEESLAEADQGWRTDASCGDEDPPELTVGDCGDLCSLQTIDSDTDICDGTKSDCSDPADDCPDTWKSVKPPVEAVFVLAYTELDRSGNVRATPLVQARRCDGTASNCEDDAFEEDHDLLLRLGEFADGPDCDTVAASLVAPPDANEDARTKDATAWAEAVAECCMAWDPLAMAGSTDDTCGKPDDTADTAVPGDSGDSGGTSATNGGGRCTILRLTLDEDAWRAPSGGDDPRLLAQRSTRSIWTQDRIRAARRTVVEWECRRWFGTTCAQAAIANDGETIDRAAMLPEMPRSGSVVDEDLTSINRYHPAILSTHDTLLTCWGDPRDGDAFEIDFNKADVGGDCAGGSRDKAEGPADLVALATGAQDCSVCADGKDNNCNGLVDEEDGGCDPCFVNQGLACGGGCSTTSPRGLALGALALSLLLMLGRRRT